MRTFILSSLILTALSSPGQTKKGVFTINIGFHQTDTYSKLFYNLSNDEISYPTKQFSATFFDFNILYSRPTKNSKLKTVIGIGVNKKGFGENGIESYDSLTYFYSYVSKLKKSYLSFYGGFSYDLFSFENIKIVIGQLLNPEIDFDNTGFYKKVPLATRTNLTLDWKVGNNFSLLLTPYFQTALTKYNKSKITSRSSNYVPFGFGLNFGVAF